MRKFQGCAAAGVTLLITSAGLLRLSRVLGCLNPLLLLALPTAVFLITPWWSGLLLVIILFFLVNSVHTETNLELGARLLALNRRIKLFDD